MRRTGTTRAPKGGMKRMTGKKLVLAKETLRTLRPDQLQGAGGKPTVTALNCSDECVTATNGPGCPGYTDAPNHCPNTHWCPTGPMACG